MPDVPSRLTQFLCFHHCEKAGKPYLPTPLSPSGEVYLPTPLSPSGKPYLPTPLSPSGEAYLPTPTPLSFSTFSVGDLQQPNSEGNRLELTDGDTKWWMRIGKNPELCYTGNFSIYLEDSSYPTAMISPLRKAANECGKPLLSRHSLLLV